MTRQQNKDNSQSIKDFNQTLNVLLVVFAFPIFGFINSQNLQIGQIDICHNTGSSTNPYVQISIASDQDLAGHQNHPNDIIPAPADGCPGEIPTPTPIIIDQTDTPQVTLTAEASEIPPVTVTVKISETAQIISTPTILINQTETPQTTATLETTEIPPVTITPEVSETTQPTSTPTFENALTPSPTESPEPTNSPEPENTRKPSRTKTPIPFPTFTHTLTPSETATPTATGTSSPTLTTLPTDTQSPANTPTPSKASIPANLQYTNTPSVPNQINSSANFTLNWPVVFAPIIFGIIIPGAIAFIIATIIYLINIKRK